MMHNYSKIKNNILVRPLEVCDIDTLRHWRNDALMCRFLRDVGYISKEQQKLWFQSYLEDTSIISFAIDECKDINAFVGNISLYDLQKESASIGRLLIGNDNAHGRKIGYNAVSAVLEIYFNELGKKQIRLDVHEDNIAAYTIYQHIGFVKEGMHLFEKGGYEYEMQLSKERFYASKCT